MAGLEISPSQGEPFKRIFVKLGHNPIKLALCIDDRKGWLETVKVNSAGSSRQGDQVVEPSSPAAEEELVSPAHHWANLKTMTGLWGLPRNSKEAFCTFDIPCEHDGEKDIFHIDVKLDSDLHITDTRLRGPGINAGVWQSELTKSSLSEAVD
jgi:hypothetical protein